MFPIHKEFEMNRVISFVIGSGYLLLFIKSGWAGLGVHPIT